MASPVYNNPSRRAHPPPSPSARFASGQTARSTTRTPSPLSSEFVLPAESLQEAPNSLSYLDARPANSRNSSVSSASSTSSTSSGDSTSPSSTKPRDFSPASLSSNQHVIDSYRSRYAAYLAASWGISPAAAGAEFEHHLHTRPGQYWPQVDRH